MNKDNDPKIQSGVPSALVEAKTKWLKVSALAACSFCIVGFFTLFLEPARGQSSGGSGGFLPGVRPLQGHPLGGVKPGSSGLGAAYDDEDDEDEDDRDEFSEAPAAAGHPSSASHPAGALPSHKSSLPPPSHLRGNPSSLNPPHHAPANKVSVSTPPSSSAGKPSVGAVNSPMMGASSGGKPVDVKLEKPTTVIQIDPETGDGKGSKEIITDFNYPDVDILDLAKALGKITGHSFIYDNKDVKGRVTIISNGPITLGAAWKAFLTALDVTGFALVRLEGEPFLRVSRQRDARDKQLKTYTGESSPNTDALIIRVFQLKYISAEEVSRTFRNFMPANSRIIPYEQTNSVIVTDTGTNIQKFSRMLDILDVEGYEAGIEVVPVKYASAAELSKLIDTLIPGTSGASPAGGIPRFGGGPAGRFNSRRTKEGGIINTIIADERTNTLIVHANSRGADQVRELVAKLDQKLPSTVGGGRVHVYYLQFADAEQIATTLNNLSQTGTGGASRPPGTAGSGTGVNPVTQSLFEGMIKISPDKATNSLVVTASPADYVTIQRVVNRLDIPRNQVYVEVVIMEVQIGRTSSYSANIFSAPSLTGSVTNPADVANLFSANPFGESGALFSFKAGQTYNMNVGGQNIAVSSVMGAIKALQGTTNANILATPQIIALDNSEASFESSDKVPTSAGSTVTATGITQQSIVKEPVVLKIKIKPHINKVTNFVAMDVTTQLGNISPTGVPPALANQTFTTQDRTATTSVVVGDGDTIIIGGLIRDDVTEQVVKIPILGDIPLLGWLFKSKSSSAIKRNLLIFMTPHIVKQYEKVRTLLDSKLKERDDFLERDAGGEDPFKLKRDEIIRSLPDIHKLGAEQRSRMVPVEEEKPPAAMVIPSIGNSAPLPINPDAINNPNGSGTGASPPLTTPTQPADSGASTSPPPSQPAESSGAPTETATPPPTADGTGGSG